MILFVMFVVFVLCTTSVESYLPYSFFKRTNQYDTGFERSLNGPYMPVESSRLRDEVYSTIRSLPYGTTPIADQGSTLKRRGVIEIPYDLNKI